MAIHLRSRAAAQRFFGAGSRTLRLRAEALSAVRPARCWSFVCPGCGLAVWVYGGFPQETVPHTCMRCVLGVGRCLLPERAAS